MPKSSFQVELIVCSGGLGTGLAALRSSEEQQGLRSTGGAGQRSPTSPTASSPAGKDLSKSKNSHWATWRGLPWKSKLCSFLPTEQRLGESPILQSPAPQGQGAAGWRPKGMKLSGRQLARRGWAQTAQTSETVFLCDLGHSLFLLLPSLVSGSKSSSLHS